MDTLATFNLVLNIITEVITIIGLTGHILTFIVFSRTTFRKNSISIYCRALAIFESFILMNAIMNIVIMVKGYSQAFSSETICKLYAYVTYGFASIPGWILIAFSIDKVLNMKKITNGMKRPYVHYLIVFVIVICSLLLYIEIPIYLKLVSFPFIGNQCDISTMSFGDVINYVYIVEANIIPFVIMFGSSLVTVKLLRDSRRQIQMGGAAGDSRKSRDTKFAITSLTFNILFIVLKMPMLICVTVGFAYVDPYFLNVSILLFNTYFSIGFFIHLASNSLFRQELLALLSFRQPIGSSNQRNQQFTNNTNN